MKMGALVRGKLRCADHKEQRMKGGKHKGEFSRAWWGWGWALEKFTAPMLCRSPGIKRKKR